MASFVPLCRVCTYSLKRSSLSVSDSISFPLEKSLLFVIRYTLGSPTVSFEISPATTFPIVPFSVQVTGIIAACAPSFISMSLVALKYIFLTVFSPV